MFTAKQMPVCLSSEESDKPKQTKLNMKAHDKDQFENSLIHLQ